ncbi:hypothetical protein TruAng_001920 [Truncatella angustata]|nr:hypothetical protein TruAng_001920 [Truncatella angustata]
MGAYTFVHNRQESRVAAAAELLPAAAAAALLLLPTPAKCRYQILNAVTTAMTAHLSPGSPERPLPRNWNLNDLVRLHPECQTQAATTSRPSLVAPWALALGTKAHQLPAAAVLVHLPDLAAAALAPLEVLPHPAGGGHLDGERVRDRLPGDVGAHELAGALLARPQRQRVRV